MSSGLRILVVDDHRFIADSVSALVQLVMPQSKVYTAYDAPTALQIIREEAISIALIDARMPDMSGIELIKSLRTQYPALKLIGMTSFAQQETVLEIIQAGVQGVFLKNQTSAIELKACLDAVLDGGRFVSEEAQKLIALTNKPPRLLQFSKRELEIIRLTSAGKSSKEVAALLNLKPATIDDYRKTMLRKTGCSNTDELATIAMRNGLL